MKDTKNRLEKNTVPQVYLSGGLIFEVTEISFRVDPEASDFMTEGEQLLVATYSFRSWLDSLISEYLKKHGISEETQIPLFRRKIPSDL